MRYEDWELTVHRAIRGDSLWRMEAYRIGLFLADLAWADATKLAAHRRCLSIADQLCRASCKISSNLGGGYSRGTGRDRARFYEYALGSVRELRDWYYKGRHVLGDKVVDHRMELCTQAAKLTVKIVNRERRTNRPVTPDDR